MLFLNIWCYYSSAKDGSGGPRSSYGVLISSCKGRRLFVILVILGYVMVYDIIRMGNGKRYTHEEWSEGFLPFFFAPPPNPIGCYGRRHVLVEGLISRVNHIMAIVLKFIFSGIPSSFLGD